MLVFSKHELYNHRKGTGNAAPEPKAKAVLERIEGSDLKLVCAFRMAASDIKEGRLERAAERIRQDKDKLLKDDRTLFQAFLSEFHKD